MDEVARLPPKDRSDLFASAAPARGLSPQIIEKDFWVCWTLRRIFALPERPRMKVLLKGGTSLSKVFGLIERFSEDVDLSFDRASLGFGAEADPLNAGSGKKRKHSLEALTLECQRVIRDEFQPELSKAFAAALGVARSSATWELAPDPDDADGQTLLFRYPSVYPDASWLPAYVRPVVRLEIGARSDPWPVEDGVVKRYAADAFPSLFKHPNSTVRVLSVGRTFWEKATMWHYAAEGRHFRDRQSRHYYDLAKLWETAVGRRAAEDLGLLEHVSKHKSVFYTAAWARYDLAKAGTLRLVPPHTRMKELESDYHKMREMIFGTPPEFDRVIETIREAENTINSIASK